MNVQLQQPVLTIDVEPPATLTAGQVATAIGLKSVETFYNKRKALEAAGFPRKLPGLSTWSRAAVLRWIETNGETYLPADRAGGDDAPANGLERRYAK